LPVYHLNRQFAAILLEQNQYRILLLGIVLHHVRENLLDCELHREPCLFLYVEFEKTPIEKIEDLLQRIERLVEILLQGYSWIA